MKKLLVILLCILSFNCFAATKYVRPTSGGPYGSADGSSYANAWSGLAAVTGLSGGDTLKVCGDLVAADADGGGSGAFRNQDVAGEIITGDCTAEGGSATSTWDLTGSGKSYGILCNTALLCQGSQWSSIHVKNAPIRGFYIRNDLDDADVVSFVGTDLSCTDTVGTEGNAPWCVAGWGGTATLTRIRSVNSTDDAVHWQGDDFTIQDSHFYFPGYNIASGSFIGDCVQVITKTARAKILRNYCDKRNANADGNVSKSCFIIGDPATAGGGEISDNICYLPNSGNSTFGSKSILSSGDDVVIKRNFVYGGYYGIFAFGANNTIESNIVVNTEFRGIEIPTTTRAGTTNVWNNVVSGAPICYILKGAAASTNIFAYNNLAMNCTTYGYEKATATYTQSNNRCDLTTPTCSNNAGTISSVNPGLVGGTITSDGNAFRLTSSSVLRRAGKDLNLGNVLDFKDRAYSHPPSIGAIEVTSNSEAASRTNATTRATRQ